MTREQISLSAEVDYYVRWQQTEFGDGSGLFKDQRRTFALFDDAEAFFDALIAVIRHQGTTRPWIAAPSLELWKRSQIVGHAADPILDKKKASA